MRGGWGGIYLMEYKGDEEEEFTLTGGRENTVIDYILGDKEVKEWIERMWG